MYNTFLSQTQINTWIMQLTFHCDAFLWPVFNLSGEDGIGPHTYYIVSHVELQREEAKHFNPEEPDFNRRMGVLKHQWNLHQNTPDST